MGVINPEVKHRDRNISIVIMIFESTKADMTTNVL